MKQTFSSTGTNEPLLSYADYKAQTFEKTTVAYEGLLKNIISGSLADIDKKELILKIKQAAERALLLDI